MRNEGSGDVWKLWLYAAASVLLGAWISPLLFNAGKALAEVSRHKTTNDFLEWLAGFCARAEFPRFYQASLLLAAVALFFPWVEWLGSRRGAAGQPLRQNPRGPWQALAGFLLSAGILFSLGMLLVPAGVIAMRLPKESLGALVTQALPLSLGLAAAMETLFRGAALGIFMRPMRPAAALGMSAVFFALVVAMNPPPGLNVADPEAAGIGFELLRKVLARLADWPGVFGNLLPLLALGGVLAYARWRTASLWLPIGLHTGWLFAKHALSVLTVETATPATGGAAFAKTMLQQGVIPLAGILLAGVLVHRLTTTRDRENPANS